MIPSYQYTGAYSVPCSKVHLHHLPTLRQCSSSYEQIRCAELFLQVQHAIICILSDDARLLYQDTSG